MTAKADHASLPKIEQVSPRDNDKIHPTIQITKLHFHSRMEYAVVKLAEVAILPFPEIEDGG